MVWRLAIRTPLCLQAGGVAAQVALDHECTDGHTECCAEACILNIDANGNLGVVHRSESHEHRVVASVRVLGRARLAAHVQTGDVGTGTGAAQYCHAHALHDIVIVVLVDIGVVPFEVFLEPLS